jgi:hypothetical protein
MKYYEIIFPCGRFLDIVYYLRYSLLFKVELLTYQGGQHSYFNDGEREYTRLPYIVSNSNLKGIHDTLSQKKIRHK